MSSWQVFTDTTELDEQLAEHLANALREDIEARGSASLAVSGGSTPQGMFQRLSRKALNWSKVSITLVDERWVDPDHVDSNTRLVRANLLQNEAAIANWVDLHNSFASAALGAAHTERMVGAMERPFTALVLGMGGDGHTASWFPRAENLQALLDIEGTALVAATDPVTAPHERITLTLPAVLGSKEILIHITGDKKRGVLESATDRAYPIARVLSQTTTPVNIWWAP